MCMIFCYPTSCVAQHFAYLISVLCQGHREMSCRLHTRIESVGRPGPQQNSHEANISIIIKKKSKVIFI